MMTQTKRQYYYRITPRPRGFTLVEVAAATLLLAVLLTGVVVAYRKTMLSVDDTFLQERAAAVAQRHIESLLGTLQEPNRIERRGQDEFDPLFDWQLELKRIPVPGARSGKIENYVIMAEVTVETNTWEAGLPEPYKLIRYFNDMTPVAGEEVAVPITPEAGETPQWFLDLENELGHPPEMDDVLKHLVEQGQMPEDVLEDFEL